MKRHLNVWCILVVLALFVSLWNFYVALRFGGDESQGDARQAPPPPASSSKTTNKATVYLTTKEKDEPTHHACDGFDGIYHVAMTDILGGVGTGLIQLVVNQIDYARRHNLKPWVHLNNSSQVVYDPLVHSQGPGAKLPAMRAAKATYVRRQGGHWRDAVPGPPNVTAIEPERDFYFAGTGVWQHYFEPVSDFLPGDASCRHKLLASMDLYLITPGLHGYSDYATRCWRYEYLPEYITKPHIPYDSWLLEQRRRAHDIMQQYIRFRPFLVDAAQRANPGCTRQQPCLGLHIRHSDKAAGRRLVATNEFLPFARAFVENGGRKIYLATDSSNVLDEIQQTWPVSVKSLIRRMDDHAVRSSDQKAVFDIASHHRTNKEALVEILALSQCQFLVHGLSAVSESSIWINIGLHNRSVNLEDYGHLSPPDFGRLVSMSLNGSPESDWPHAERTDEWWKENNLPQQKQTSTGKTCEGYKGMLLISAVDRKSSVASAFFTDVLNQLLYAKQNNLLPWIHLQNGTDLIMDPAAHLRSPSTSSPRGGFVQVHVIDATPSSTCPADFDAAATMAPHSTLSLQGNGVWDSYFMPVSDFSLADPICSGLPIVSISGASIMPALNAACPYSVKAWRYDDVLHWNPTKASLYDLFGPMRRKASGVVKEFYSCRPHIAQRAELVNPVGDGEACLGVHVRVGDKAGKFREKIKADRYLPYLQAFARSGGKTIYLASDSHRAINYIIKSLGEEMSKMVRTQGPQVVRTNKEYSTHFIDEHHRVNSETLVDILALSRCSLLLHSHSTVSEAAIYLNNNLHLNSVNLEDPDHLSPDQFESLSRGLFSS